MNNLDKQYKELLETILHYGVDKKDRTGRYRSILGTPSNNERWIPNNN